MSHARLDQNDQPPKQHSEGGNAASLAKEELRLIASIKDKKHQIATLTRELRDAKRYQKEQELVVEQTVSIWSSQLTEFQAEANVVQTEKNKLSGDIIRLEQEREALADEAKALEDKVLKLDELYAKRVQRYRADLLRLDEEIAQKMALQ
jgi:chromosome segregation ATPase